MQIDIKDYYQKITNVPIADIARELLSGRIVSQSDHEIRVDCPHHTSASHASFIITPAKQQWHCFGCDAGGDVLHLVEFVQSGCVSHSATPTHKAARDWLAQRAGMQPLAHYGLSPEEVATLEREKAQSDTAYAVLRAVMAYYAEQLQRHGEVIEWIKRQYAFDDATIKEYGIGYADNDGLLSHLHDLGFDDAQIISCGAFTLQVTSQHEIPVPFWRNRVTFPYSKNGNVVYGIARKTYWTENNKYEVGKYKKLLTQSDKHRYIAAGIKNDVLYNEDCLACRPEQVIITEGITDCIALLRRGFTVISPVTVNIRHEDWQRIIPKLRHVQDVVLCQDNELSKAGWKGALASAKMLLENGISCRIAQLPLGATQREAYEQLQRRYEFSVDDGKESLDALKKGLAQDECEQIDKLVEQAKQDVASYFVQGNTASDFRKVIGDAKSPLEYAIAMLPDDMSEADMERAITPILGYVSRESTLRQSALLKLLREKTNIGVTDLRKAMTKLRRNAPASTDTKYALTDLGNAFRLQDRFADTLCYCKALGEWQHYNGVKWEPDDTGEALRAAHVIAQDIPKETDAITDEDMKCAILDWAKRCEDATRSEAVLKQSRAYMSEKYDKFDAQPWLLNCANGIVNLQTGELLPHDYSYYLRQYTDVFYDPAARCPEWQQFLLRVFEGNDELIAYMQKAVGYTLTGLASNEVCFFLYGDKAHNGKSTFISTIRQLMGEYAQNIQSTTLMKSRYNSAQAASPDIAGVMGKRFAVTDEIPDGERFDDRILKNLSSNDLITARSLYGMPVAFTPTHKLWMFGNSKPDASVMDNGVWRRLKMIPFNYQIPRDKAVDNYAHDVLFPELSGILNWALEGCFAWQQAGSRLRDVAVITDAIEVYKNEVDRLSQFIKECCVFKDYYAVNATDLYKYYLNWCMESEIDKPVSQTKFARQIKSLPGVSCDPKRKIRQYDGIDLTYKHCQE